MITPLLLKKDLSRLLKCNVLRSTIKLYSWRLVSGSVSEFSGFSLSSTV